MRGRIVFFFFLEVKNQNTMVPLLIEVTPILHHTLIKNVDSGARLLGLRFRLLFNFTSDK